jgi:protein ImuB
LTVPASTRPPRLAVVWCPQWPVAAAGCAPDEAVAVVHANRIVARSRAAAAAGVAVGHRRRESQGRCPNLRLVPTEPARDAREFQRVVEAVATIVPRLELTEPGVLTFPTRGPSRYFGGDDAMAAKVLALVDEAVGDLLVATGRPGVGIADGRFAAGVAARRAVDAGRPLVVAPAGSPAFLERLPLRWLVDVGGLDPDQVALFGRLGLHDLGALAALPPADVVGRFGRFGVAAQQMAAGCDDRPAGTDDPPPGLAMTHQFESPVHHLDTVVFAGKQLAGELAGALGAQGRVCTQLEVTAETEHGETCTRLWSRSTGLNVGAMVERIRWQLDGWAGTASGDAPARATSEVTPDAVDVVTAGIIQLRIEPVAVRADDGTQLGLWGGRTQADEWAQRATARVIGLVGDDDVVVPAWRGGRQPDDMYQWVPAGLSDLADASVRLGDCSATPWPGQLPPPSPAVVHQNPIAVTVADSGGAPVAVSGRGAISAAPATLYSASGSSERVVAWAGPWLLEERWWDAARQRRMARFQLLTESGRAFLATVERHQWWLVAEYA